MSWVFNFTSGGDMRIEQERGRENMCFPVEEGSECTHERWKTVGFQRVRYLLSRTTINTKAGHMAGFCVFIGISPNLFSEPQ